MKKKLGICGSICILGLGVFILLIMNKRTDDNSEKEDTSVSVEATTELNFSVTEEIMTDTTEEDMTNTYEEDAQNVYYLEDEAVRNDPIFHAFVGKEQTAYDKTDSKNKYVYEYFEDYSVIFGVHYMAEDLDGDDEDELLIFLQKSDSHGDLLVFDEVDGELYAWETWKDFLIMRRMEIKYYGNGIFSMGGGAGDIFGYYNSEGEIEYILEFYRRNEILEPREDGIFLRGGELVVYKDGIVEKDITYEGTYYRENDCWEFTTENQESKDECDAILNEIRTELGKGELVNHIEWEENAEQITLEELLRP